MVAAEDLGKMIYSLRRKKCLTQKELADHLLVSDKTVSRWENGLGYPEITLLPKLSEILGVSTDYLLKGNPRKIVIAGYTITDIVNVIDKYPEKHMLANILSVEKAVGGCVPNTAIDLAKIDVHLLISAVARVGNDDNGRFVLSQLQKYGVDTSQVVISKKQPTGVAHVMSEEKTGARTFFCAKGANREFDLDDVSIDLLDCTIFHIGYACFMDALDKEDAVYGTRMARLLHKLNEQGIKTSIDAISVDTDNYTNKMLPILKYCTYVIINEIESSMVSGLSPRYADGTLNIENIKNTMQLFLEYGVQEMVIIHCAEAGFLMTATGEFVMVPSLKLPDDYVKGSVGAGDAFAAGCLYGIYKGFGNQKILEFASGAAAASLSATDSVSGMIPAKEIEKLIVQYGRKQGLNKLTTEENAHEM